MMSTASIDDDLYKQALELAGPAIDKADLLREAIKTFVRARGTAFGRAGWCDARNA